MGLGLLTRAARRVASRASLQRRAADQGYDVARPVYHGSPRPMEGDTYSASQAVLGNGVSVSRNPKVADYYATYGAPPPNGGPNVAKMYVRGKMATKEQMDALVEKHMKASRHDVAEAHRRAEKELQQQGYAGVDDPATEYSVVFDPGSLRLPHAMFDPRKIGQPDLLAGLGGGALVGGGLLSRGQRT